MRALSVLGSTGSIGRQTLEVAAACGHRVLALTAHHNIALLEQQARTFHPILAAAADPTAAAALAMRLSDTDIRVLAGEEGVLAAARLPQADTAVTALVGIAGLAPTLAAIDSGKRIALANKETLVCAGPLVMARAREKGAEIVPVDSEHSAIFQSLQGSSPKELRRILLTASGGPFFGWSREALEGVTPARALQHPNWSMGAKVTIDSATLMNKGLELLGVEPVLGAEFTLTFGIGAGSVETTQTFTLCGWWEYDEAIPADHVLIPESRLESILAETGYVPGQDASGAGLWGLDVMLDSSLHIEQDVQTILANHGYQDQNRQEDNYVNTGVNWGYTGAKMAENMDPATLAALAAVLLLIVFTGYLIIYNVFQISVTNDIRFYGLLKTIGTTGRQIKALLRQQALLLSCIGIPIGLVLGWMVGGLLAPMVIQRLDGVVSTVSVHPLIFVGSALFALFTVLLSCAKPGRLAAKVSPIEAVRYTEGSQSKKKAKRGSGRVSPFSMARANLGRSKGKTVVTVLSLSLAVVLTTITATFVGGFDMDKYLSKSICTDFVLADAGHFQVGDTFHAGMALPQEVIDQVTSQGGVAEGGKVYGMTTAVQEGVTEDWFRSANQQWYTEEQMESLITGMERDAGNHLLDRAQLYGMEGFALDQLDVMEGDLSKLYEPGGRYIAAVYNKDDYGKWRPDSHWAKVGDQVTLRYVSEFEYYSPTTGEVFGSEPPEKEAYLSRAVEYQEVTYEVAALVAVPSCLGYGYYGADEFVLNDATFCQDTQSDSVMLYAFNTQEGGATAMEDFLADYTENQNPQYDYVSKVTYQAEFESFRAMFLMLGGALSFIVGLVGVLNFFNAILTGILTRKREFAVLQSIGMTGRQLKIMLVWEGLFYALGSILIALVLALVLGPLSAPTLENLFWFFTYHLTVTPVLILLPIFLLLGGLVPLAVYRSVARVSVVERLREAEG